MNGDLARVGSGVTHRGEKATGTETLSGRGYQLIRDDILSGNLPPGSKLRIDALRRRYALGPTPLREALSRLSSEGLVLLEQQRGFRVAPVTLAELEDLSRMRVLLESEAIRRSIAAGGDAWQARVVGAFHKLDRLERADAAVALDFDVWELRNREFHDALVPAADAPWLLRTRLQFYDQHERYRRLSRGVGDQQPLRNLHSEHRAIMDAALRRDAEAAAALLEQHIGRTVDQIRHRLPQMPRR